MIERITERLERNDRAVSPVIGVILMVAITVILAAVIGTFVLDLGSNVGQSAPQASMGVADHNDDFNESASSSNAIRINHDGGEDLSADTFEIQIRRESNNSLVGEWSSGSWTDSTGASVNLQVALNGAGSGMTTSDIVSTGDQLVISTTASSVLSDDTRYKVVFIDKDAGEQIASATVTVR